MPSRYIMASVQQCNAVAIHGHHTHQQPFATNHVDPNMLVSNKLAHDRSPHMLAFCVQDYTLTQLRKVCLPQLSCSVSSVACWLSHAFVGHIEHVHCPLRCTLRDGPRVPQSGSSAPQGQSIQPQRFGRFEVRAICLILQGTLGAHKASF
jgi:hypothetical protein